MVTQCAGAWGRDQFAEHALRRDAHQQSLSPLLCQLITLCAFLYNLSLLLRMCSLLCHRSKLQACTKARCRSSVKRHLTVSKQCCKLTHGLRHCSSSGKLSAMSCLYAAACSSMCIAFPMCVLCQQDHVRLHHGTEHLWHLHKACQLRLVHPGVHRSCGDLLPPLCASS